MKDKSFRVMVIGDVALINTVKYFDTFDEALAEYVSIKEKGCFDTLSLTYTQTILEVTKNGNDN